MRLTITRPDDWHLHLRDGAELAAVLPHTAASFGRAIVMPNLDPPVTTLAMARAYRKRIVSALPDQDDGFEPLMTLYLTDETAADEIAAGANDDAIVAAKLYPAGATTNSARGVTKIERIYPALEALAEHGLPLLVHAEIVDAAVDIFDRESVFVERVLEPVVRRFPTLKVVVEHATTRDALDFVRSFAPRIAATITPHHLMLNRNDLLAGGIHPHLYCLPVVKREKHRLALVEAATGGERCFFLGTDSAPHGRGAKETDCGCAGIYSAHAALPFYAQVFERAGALDNLEAFASHHGADFYGLPRNSTTITLDRSPWRVPESYAFGNDILVPLGAGNVVDWCVRMREYDE